MTSRGWFVRSEAQSQKLDRKPCGMAAMPCSLTSFESVMSESAFPRRLGNTSPTPSLRSPAPRHRYQFVVARHADGQRPSGTIVSGSRRREEEAD